MKKIVTLLAVLASTQALSAPLEAELITKTFEVSALKNTQTYLTSMHHASVTNNTDQVQPITVSYRICAENKGCDNSHHFRVKVNPHATWQDGTILHLYPTYAVQGNFAVNAYTSVTGLQLNQTFPAVSYIHVK